MGLGIKTRIRFTRKAINYSLKSTQRVKSLFLRSLLLCHSLEKGMGITNVRKGYGQKKADELISILIKMNEMSYNNTYEFKESLAVLKAYFSFHEKQNTDVLYLKKKAESILKIDHAPFNGGYRIIEHSELMKGKEIDYESFVNSRHSMRTYNSTPINKDIINKVISIAKRAPSACNREPWKFYYSLDVKKSQVIAAALPSQSFLKDIPYFGVVTVDRSLFNQDEIYQWYINGGIFLQSLVNAFHSQGIGSCIFQYPVFIDSKQELYKFVKIPKNEELIAAVGFGYYPDQAKCICAERRPNILIAKEID